MDSDVIYSREENGYCIQVHELDSSYVTTVSHIPTGKPVPCFPRQDTGAKVGEMNSTVVKLTKKQAKMEMLKLARKQAKEHAKTSNMSKKDIKRMRSQTTKHMMSETNAGNTMEYAIQAAKNYPMDMFKYDDMIENCWRSSVYGIKGMDMTPLELSEFEPDQEHISDAESDVSQVSV